MFRPRVESSWTTSSKPRAQLAKDLSWHGADMEAVIESAAPGSGVTQSDHQHSVGSGKTPAAAEDEATRQWQQRRW